MLTPSSVLVYLARHGKTGLNADNKFRGNKDVPLNSDGVAEAHRLASLFEDIDISHIISSDRQRATKTAEIIAAKKHTEIHTSENLRALNVGEFSGKDRDKTNTDALQTYLDDPDTTIPGGESLNDFKARIRPCIEEAVTLADEEGKPVLLVCHSSVVHEVGDFLMGHHTKVLVHPGGVVAIYVEGSKLVAKPLYKPVVNPPNRADTVS